MHGWSLVYWHDAFWCRWMIIQGAVWSDCVVVAAPSFDQDLSLTQREEEDPVQQLAAEAGVEALAVSVFPR